MPSYLENNEIKQHAEASLLRNGRETLRGVNVI